MIDEKDLKNDFRLFLQLVWLHLGLKEPTKLQYEFAKELQNSPDRCVMLGFRSLAKSYITSAYVLWQLYKDCDKKILVVSAGRGRANDFSTFVLELINEIEILNYLSPKRDDRYSRSSFDVGPAKPSHAPSVKSLSIHGQLTGSKADIIIGDDIESLNNSLTPGKRRIISEVVREFEAIRNRGGKIILLGTPQTEHTVYSELPDRGYSVMVWPAIYPANPEIYEGRLADYIYKGCKDKAGQPTDPDRFSLVDLEEKKLAYGKAGFALQYMLDTKLTAIGKYPLKLSDLICFSCDINKAPDIISHSNTEVDVQCIGVGGDKWCGPGEVSEEYSPYEFKVMAIDPSGRGNDETAYTVVGYLNGMAYILTSGGFIDGFSEHTLKALSVIAHEFSVDTVVVENNFGGGTFTALLEQTLANIHQCNVVEVRAKGVKEIRILNTLEPLFNLHKLVINKDLVISDAEDDRDPERTLTYQIARMSNIRGVLKHDDRVDSLAIAIDYISDKFALDTNTEIERTRKLKAQREWQEYMDLVFGQEGSQNNILGF